MATSSPAAGISNPAFEACDPPLEAPSPEGDVKGKTEWLPHPKGGRDNVYKAENLTCGEGGRRKDYIVEDGDNRMEIQGFVRSGFRTFATWCLIVLSGFLLRLLFHWKPHWFLRCTHRRTTLALATRLEITQIYKKWKDHFVRPVLSMERPVAVSKRADSSHRPTTPWAPLRVASAILDISRHDHSVQLHPS
ncbi:unnamed protein product [Cyprideis torosa]|uniref:Cation-transporting ATPase n=1 Tax=Cyprideis torosa TaxID=163714 RepID=A0A7R8WE88_9CRUS|nr:unnamed protein product [Cyprideis torosa]CAG0895463.1 unnamed protein product [Cyprideis torosa]